MGVYLWSVKAAVACPASACRSRIGSPRWASTLKHECRRSRKRIGGSLARLKSGLKWRLTTFCASRAVPTPEANASP
jgi:hypothetical protein